jgi:hypothetical protein
METAAGLQTYGVREFFFDYPDVFEDFYPHYGIDSNDRGCLICKTPKLEFAGNWYRLLRVLMSFHVAQRLKANPGRFHRAAHHAMDSPVSFSGLC